MFIRKDVFSKMLGLRGKGNGASNFSDVTFRCWVRGFGVLVAISRPTPTDPKPCCPNPVLQGE